MNIETLSSQSFIDKDNLVNLLKLSKYDLRDEGEKHASDICSKYLRFLETNKCITEHEKYMQKAVGDLVEKLQPMGDHDISTLRYAIEPNILYFLYVYRGKQEILGAIRSYDICKTSDEDWAKIWTQPEL